MRASETPWRTGGRAVLLAAALLAPPTAGGAPHTQQLDTRERSGVEGPAADRVLRAQSRALLDDPADARARPDAPLARGRPRLAARDFLRPRILLEAGLGKEAGQEVRRLARRARGLKDRLELAHLARDCGDFQLAHRIVVDGYSETLARGPVPHLEDLWWYAWPSAYLPLVDRATRTPGSAPPELVYSVMREESGFRATVVSPVGARGLLQIMVETGQNLALRHGMKGFEGEDLFDPGANIDLGTRYLTELTRLFGGRTSASIASYNAGPEAVAKWEPDGTLEDDEWVEGIPYSQTRTYVKRVLRGLHAYRVLY